MIRIYHNSYTYITSYNNRCWGGKSILYSLKLLQKDNGAGWTLDDEMAGDTNLTLLCETDSYESLMDEYPELFI